MKNLKLGLLSLLTILAISFFLTSCEQETTNIDTPYTPYETAVNYDYQKAIVSNKEHSKSKNTVNAVIRLSSDSEEILTLFNEKNIQVEKNENIVEEQTLNKKSNYHEHNGDCETHSQMDDNSFEKNLKIEVILDSKLKEKSGYTLSFSDELVSKFEGQNISTQINFLNVNTEKATQKRLTINGSWGSGDWIDLPWWAEYEALNTKSAVFIGDGRSTKVTTYHSHSPTSSPHVFNNKYFKNCHHTYDCRSNHTLTAYKVQYGMVKKIHIYTHCGGRC